MIITLNPVTIGGQPPLKEYLALAQEYDFGGVEFSIGEVKELGGQTSVSAVKSLFDDAGVVPATFGLPVEWRRDETAFQEGMKNLPALAQAAQEIGCTRCCTWIPPAIQEDPIVFRNQIRARFHDIAAILGDFGIRFGLEWVGPSTLRHGPKAMGPNPFIWNMPATLELIADIDPPHNNIGLLVDSFHWFTTGATVADLEALKTDQIVHVHINDAPDRPHAEQMDQERLLPGEGVIDLQGFLQALQRVGYQGPLAVETFGKELPALGFKEAARRTRESVTALLPDSLNTGKAGKEIS